MAESDNLEGSIVLIQEANMNLRPARSGGRMTTGFKW
jgi:hypothetical protein